MGQYVVTEGCYVPVGESTRFKVAGQVVTLDEKDAKVLGGLVKSAGKRTVAAQVVAGQAADSGDTGDAAEADIVDEDEDDTPAQSASKAEWVDFAVSQGQSREEAEALTKAELVELLG